MDIGFPGAKQARARTRALFKRAAALALALALARASLRSPPAYIAALLRRLNTKGYSSTYLAMGFANVRAGTSAAAPNGLP